MPHIPVFDIYHHHVISDGRFFHSFQIYMGIRGSAANYGMIAVSDIEPGEEIFRIPIERTLCWENLRVADKLRPGMLYHFL